MFVNKKIKYFLLICLCIIFMMIVGFAIVSENSDLAKEVSNINIEEIENSLQLDTNLKFNIKLGDIEGYYNSLENTYYFLIDEKYSNTYLKPKIKISSEEKLQYTILNKTYNPKDGLYVNFNEYYDFLIYNDKNYYKSKIKFTCLPIVNITATQEITTEAQAAIVEVYSNDYNDGKGTKKTLTETLLYVRGGSSNTFYPKKQYRLKLRKDNEYNEVSLLGMDADEDWILDALYSDYSKIRNKLSFDIWNEMNSYTSNNFNNDIEMEYVEVYINQEYHGLYLLKEFVDWKKLDLDKNSEEDSGILMKALQYGDIDWEKYEEDKYHQVVYPFIIKYPKEQKNYSIYWDTILPKICTNFFDVENITEEYLLDNFYIHNYNDYKLFINFICADDNFEEKNVYMSLKNLKEDTKVLLTPWDLDMTYGYSWEKSSITKLEESPDNLSKVVNLWIDSEFINGLLKERYWELRKQIFNMDNINKKIDSYYNQIKYAVPRDGEKWLETDLEEETNKIRNWLEKRIEILDEEFR